MQVLFVRHGESQANLENVIVSHNGDPDLTDKGREEARRLAQYWAEAPLVALYASPLLRARKTAAAFIRPGVEVTVDDRLHEIGLGRWDGLAIPDIELRDGERYRQWKHNPELAAPDGGERLSQVALRMQAFLSDIRAAGHEGLTVAITHSDCLKALILMVLDAPWQSAQQVHLMNTGGVLVQWRDQHWQLMVHPLAP